MTLKFSPNSRTPANPKACSPGAGLSGSAKTGINPFVARWLWNILKVIFGQIHINARQERGPSTLPRKRVQVVSAEIIIAIIPTSFLRQKSHNRGGPLGWSDLRTLGGGGWSLGMPTLSTPVFHCLDETKDPPLGSCNCASIRSTLYWVPAVCKALWGEKWPWKLSHLLQGSPTAVHRFVCLLELHSVKQTNKQKTLNI